MTDLGRQIGERAQAAAEATPPPLLDLVRQHGEERRQQGYAQANPADGMDVVRRHGEAAQALFDRIAALVAQQPVQARSGHELLWQHGCEQVRIDVNQPGPFDCGTLGCTGPWRPLLVGGNPAPDVEVERYQRLLKTQASNFSAATDKLIAERAEARAEVEHERKNSAYLHEIIAEFKAAQPDPLVLSLPEVPRKDVALVAAKGTRFVPVGGASWQAEVEHGRCFGLGELLDLAGPLTVELAPPREPRTWPKLDGDPDGVTAVRGASGQVYRAGRGGWRPDDDSAWCDSFASLQNYDGPLTEVLDEPDGAR